MNWRNDASVSAESSTKLVYLYNIRQRAQVQRLFCNLVRIHDYNFKLRWGLITRGIASELAKILGTEIYRYCGYMQRNTDVAIKMSCRNVSILCCNEFLTGAMIIWGLHNGYIDHSVPREVERKNIWWTNMNTFCRSISSSFFLQLGGSRTRKKNGPKVESCWNSLLFFCQLCFYGPPVGTCKKRKVH